MARDVKEEKVGIAAGRAEEKGAEEAHDQRIPGTAGPHVHKGKVVRVNEDLAVPEEVRPRKKGDKQGEKLPKVDVKRGGGRKPSDAAEGGERERKPTTAEDPADTQSRRVGKQVKVGTGNRRSLKDGNTVPSGKEGDPPEDIRPGVSGQANAMVEAGGRGGKVDEAAKEKAAGLDDFGREGKMTDEGKQLTLGTAAAITPSSKERQESGELVSREAGDVQHGIDLDTQEG